MPPSYTILFAPIESQGHFNACIGLGQQLLRRGHRVTFATPNIWKGKLEPIGFVEEYYQDADEPGNEKWGDIVASMAPAMALPTITKMAVLNYALLAECVKKAKEAEPGLRKVMSKVKPDVVVVDGVMHSPALMNQGIPWILASSLNPLGTLVSPELPPGFAGYSIINGDATVWQDHLALHRQVFRELFLDFQAWVVDQGGPALQYNGSPYWLSYSPWANVSMFPREMSYTFHAPPLRNWHNFDAFLRTEEGSFETPLKLTRIPGKLVYFSMGTIGSSELGLMRRLLGMLAKSPNRFIVSTGPLGDQLDLADNMWGAKCLKQTLILPKVDLVITHGGNNTVTESFYFGKPLLVLPLFCDQLDNAARIDETGFGIRLEPYHLTEPELLAGIETLLGDELLKKRMNCIGIRIRGSNCQELAAQVIESVAQTTKTNNPNNPNQP